MSFIKGDNPKEQKHFDFLERLRQSGATNMWGAGSYLRDAFPRDFPAKTGSHDEAAGAVLTKWMKRHDQPEYVLEKKST